jgi:hypothetical protein
LINATNDPSFNNYNNFTSKPKARLLPNGTILMYYIYSAAIFPIPPCGSHYKAATSSDGIHFNVLGCVYFTSGYDNFVDPTFETLPNGTIMFMAGPETPQFMPPGTKLGIYRAYSTDKSYLNFSALKLVISAPTPTDPSWPSGVTDPEVIALSNGTYRIYYDGATDNGTQMAIYSATWKPIPVSVPNSTTSTIPKQTSIYTTTPTTVPTTTTTLVVTAPSTSTIPIIPQKGQNIWGQIANFFSRLFGKL